MFDIFFVIAAYLLFFGVPAFFVVNKAGFNPWFSLISLIPLANVIAWWLFALADWPSTTTGRRG